MTVKELKKFLNTLPPDMAVVILDLNECDEDYGGVYPFKMETVELVRESTGKPEQVLAIEFENRMIKT